MSRLSYFAYHLSTPAHNNAVVIAVLAVKAVEKGFRSLKEEHLHDYNARKANIDAAEKAMWDEVSKYASSSCNAAGVWFLRLLFLSQFD